MRKWLVLAALAFPALAAQPATQPVPPAVQAAAPAAPANPFFAEWTTPFGVPPFGAIEVAHYMPAFTEGITRERAEVAAIVKNPEPPTFGNTVVALDGAGEFLDRVQTVFYGQLSAETSDALQAVAKDVAPQLAALSDDINLDPALFARVKTVWEKRDASGLTAEQKKLVDETYKGFVRGGANLDATGQERLRAINKELSLEGLRFGDNVLRETNAYRLVIEKRDDLAGLPPGVVNGAAAAAKAACTFARSVTSQPNPKTAEPVFAEIRSAVSRAPASLTSSTVTARPSPASRSAIAAPIPRAPPVTTALDTL